MIRGQSNRIIYLEILRIIALFAVIYNHTDIWGWTYYTKVAGLEMWVSLFFACLCKISIPIYLMISGATLLCKKEDLSTLFRKRVFRIVILIILTSVTNYFYMSSAGIVQMSFSEFLKNSVSTFQFCTYYLWMYVSFLIVLPFLRNTAQNISAQEIMYLFALQILIKMILPIISTLFEFNIENLRQFLCLITELYTYPIFGYYIVHHKNEIRALLKYKFCPLIFFGFSVLVFAIHICLKYICVFYLEISNETFDNIIGISAIIWFYFISNMNFQFSKGTLLRRIILWISPNTLGAFLLSAILIHKFIYIYHLMVVYVPSQLAVFIWVGVTLIICVIITDILRKLPILRKIL